MPYVWRSDLTHPRSSRGDSLHLDRFWSLKMRTALLGCKMAAPAALEGFCQRGHTICSRSRQPGCQAIVPSKDNFRYHLVIKCGNEQFRYNWGVQWENMNGRFSSKPRLIPGGCMWPMWPTFFSTILWVHRPYRAYRCRCHGAPQGRSVRTTARAGGEQRHHQSGETLGQAGGAGHGGIPRETQRDVCLMCLSWFLWIFARGIWSAWIIRNGRIDRFFMVCPRFFQQSHALLPLESLVLVDACLKRGIAILLLEFCNGVSRV